jgi:hypothetical protein
MTDRDIANPIEPPHANFELVQSNVAPGTGRLRYISIENKHIYMADP